MAGSQRARLRTAQLVVALIGVTFAAACTRVDAPPTTSAVHELRIADTHEPGSLDPLVAFTQSDIAYDQLFCQTLVRAGGAGRVIAQLITRLPSRENGDISPDGKQITYHLRHDVRFADGVSLTSRDVAFTLRALLDPRNRAASTRDYRRITALQTPDAYTVRVRLREPWNAAVGTFFAAAAYAYGILPAHAFKDTQVTGTPWEQHAFGTGPFRVVAWRHGDRIVLERNPYYRPRPRLDRIVLQIIPNFETARVALVSGTVDIAPVLPAAVNELRRRPGLHVVVNYLNGVTVVALNTRLPPTDEFAVRRAIAAAIDTQALAKLQFGIGRPVRSFLAPPIVTWRTQPATSTYRYDRAVAERELDAAGWRRRAPDAMRQKNERSLTLIYAADADDASDVARAVALQAQLAEIGVTLSIKSFARQLYSAPDGPVRGGRFNLTDGSEISGDDPEQSVWNACTQDGDWGTNFGHYCRPRYNAVFADQARTASTRQREHDFDELERMVIDDVAMVPLFEYMFIVGVSDRVRDYRTDYLEFPLDAERWDIARR
jgi:peptide/nickel transport system substrate-binding protein